MWFYHLLLLGGFLVLGYFAWSKPEQFKQYSKDRV